MTKPGKAAGVKATVQPESVQLKTKRVGALSIDLAELGTSKEIIELDEQRIEVAELPTATSIVRFERLAGIWQPTSVEEPEPADEVLTGLQMRFGKVAFVFGTLGDDQTNWAQQQLAHRLAKAWRDGSDSLNVHPGDRRIDMEFPVWPDTNAKDGPIGPTDFVLIGTLRTNLLLTRVQQALPIQFHVERELDCFEREGKVYADPRDAVAAVIANPLQPQSKLLVLSANSAEGYDGMGKLPTALLPSYLIFRGHEVLDWGYLRAR
jgi:hypothetical protein